MNIYDYINSRDVAEHCRSINKSWDVCAMAAIIYDSRKHTMDEKHTAYQALIDQYPDAPALPNMQGFRFTSTHKKLAEMMDYERKVLELFKMPESDAVYQWHVYPHRQYGREVYSSSAVYRTWEKALEYAKEEWQRDEISGITIKKIYIDGEKGSVEVAFDYDGNVKSCYYSEIRGTPFFAQFAEADVNVICGIWLEYAFYLDIPIPFKRGDVLICSGDSPEDARSVFVLDSIEHFEPETLAKYLRGERGDRSDMRGWGLFVGDDGVIYGDHTGYFDYFEYYRGEFKRERRILHYVSLFMNGQIRLPELMVMQCRIMLDCLEESSLGINKHGVWIQGDLLAENRLTPEEKERIEKEDGLMPWVAKKLSKHHVEFLAREVSMDKKAVQMGLINGGGRFLGICAGIVHVENHYDKTGDAKYNPERKAMARSVLEAYGHTENDWKDKHSRWRGKYSEVIKIMTVRELFFTWFSDFHDTICTHFQLDDASSLAIYLNPDKPPEYADKEVYLGIHRGLNGNEIQRHYFSADIALEELDGIFSNEVSEVILDSFDDFGTV